MTLVISTETGIKIIVLSALIVICGLTMWVNPNYRIPAGVVGMIIGILSLQSANFGGFGLGMLCCIIGSALGLAWEKNNGGGEKDLHNDLTNGLGYNLTNGLSGEEVPPRDSSRNSSRNTHFFSGLRYYAIALFTMMSTLFYHNSSHAVPIYGLSPQSALFLASVDRLETDKFVIDGVGTTSLGYHYAHLTFGHIRFHHFILNFPFHNEYRGSLTTGPESLTFSSPDSQIGTYFVIRSLRADFYFNGVPFGRWTIDSNGLPMQLAELFGIPRTRLTDSMVLGTLKMNNLQFEAYYFETGTFDLPQTILLPS